MSPSKVINRNHFLYTKLAFMNCSRHGADKNIPEIRSKNIWLERFSKTEHEREIRSTNKAGWPCEDANTQCTISKVCLHRMIDLDRVTRGNWTPKILTKNSRSHWKLVCQTSSFVTLKCFTSKQPPNITSRQRFRTPWIETERCYWKCRNWITCDLVSRKPKSVVPFTLYYPWFR